MKIVRIIARLNVGGPARHVVWLTERLNNSEFESVLIAGRVPKGEEDMAYFAAEHGVKPIYIEQMSRELSLNDIASLFKILAEIRRHKPDIIHTHTAKAGTVGRTAAFFYNLFKPTAGRAKVVHTFHGHVFHSYYSRAKTRIFIAIERLLARVATDKIIVISPQQREEINETYGVGRPEQFEIIPLGIEVDAFAPTPDARDAFRSEFGLADDEIAVGFVGRLTEIKDVSLYLNTAAKIRIDPAAPRMRFIIVGDGHLRESLEHEAETLGIRETVLFAGNRTDLRAVYAGLDIVALTSRNEGTPLSLIEAMAAGRPVIATRVGGVRDLLGETLEEHDGVFATCSRGIAVDSRSPDDFAKGLIYLAKNERLRTRFAGDGRNFVLESYSRDRLIGDISRLYRSLAPEK